MMIKDYTDDFINLLSTTTEKQRIKWVTQFLSTASSIESIEVDTFGNLTAKKKCEGVEYVPTLNAHLDTVHDATTTTTTTTTNKIIIMDREQGLITSPQGIGGDDLCGVFTASLLLKNLDIPLQAVYTSQEETGSVGASHYQFTTPPSFIFTLDRQGDSDFVHHTFGQQYCTKKQKKLFLEIIKKHKYSWGVGIYSDMNIFSASGYAGINMSVGYYNPHTRYEYINMSVMQKAYDCVVDILPFFGGDVAYRVEHKKTQHAPVEKHTKNYNYNMCEVCTYHIAHYYYEYQMILCSECYVYFSQN